MLSTVSSDKNIFNISSFSLFWLLTPIICYHKSFLTFFPKCFLAVSYFNALYLNSGTVDINNVHCFQLILCSSLHSACEICNPLDSFLSCSMRFTIHSSYLLLISSALCPVVFITCSFLLPSSTLIDGATFNFLITYFPLAPQNTTWISLITSSFLLQFLVLVTKPISFFLLLLNLASCTYCIRLHLRTHTHTHTHRTRLDQWLSRHSDPSTLQHATFTTDKTLRCLLHANPQSQQASGCRPTS